MLKFEHQYSSSYYPQGNGQVEAVNKIIKTMLQRMVGNHKTNWNHMLFLALWSYSTSTKIATGFTPFHLIQGVEYVLPIECQIPYLRLAVELLLDTSPLEERLLQIEKTIEDHWTALQAVEAVKKWSKSYYDSHVHPRTFSEGDMVQVYDQSNDKLGKGKFESMWYGPYAIHHFLGKGAYILVDSDGQLLENPRNGLYLKIFYA